MLWAQEWTSLGRECYGSFGRRPQVAVDIGHHPRLHVEEPSTNLLPATQLVDRKQGGRRGEVELAEHLFYDRAVAVLREDALRLGRPQEVFLDTPPLTGLSTLSLHDALPTSAPCAPRGA